MLEKEMMRLTVPYALTKDYETPKESMEQFQITSGTITQLY